MTQSTSSLRLAAIIATYWKDCKRLQSVTFHSLRRTAIIATDIFLNCGHDVTRFHSLTLSDHHCNEKLWTPEFFPSPKFHSLTTLDHHCTPCSHGVAWRAIAEALNREAP